MVRIGADTTLGVSAGTDHTAVKATEIQCRTKTNVPGYSEGGGKPQRRLRKVDIEHGNTQKPRARIAGIEPTTIGASVELDLAGY